MIGRDANKMKAVTVASSSSLRAQRSNPENSVMYWIAASLTLLAMTMLVPSAARAACTNPAAVPGEIIYNSTYKVPMGCVETEWVAMGEATDPCAGSPAPGDVCLDGTVYAGNLSGTDLFVPPVDQSADIAWNNGTGNWTVTGATSTTDGVSNTVTLDGLADAGSPYQAAKLCADLNAHGHTDWYLPARNELNVLYTNLAAIGGFDTRVGTSSYWSSTDATNATAWIQIFFNGFQLSNNKNNTHAVRCARR
jgi:hypothetical protein